MLENLCSDLLVGVLVVDLDADELVDERYVLIALDLLSGGVIVCGSECGGLRRAEARPRRWSSDLWRAPESQSPVWRLALKNIVVPIDPCIQFVKLFSSLPAPRDLLPPCSILNKLSSKASLKLEP